MKQTQRRQENSISRNMTLKLLYYPARLYAEALNKSGSTIFSTNGLTFKTHS